MKIGILSSNLYRHSVGHLLTPIVAELAARHKVTLYSLSPGTDDLTERIKQGCEWVDCLGRDSADVADAIDCDVLVCTDGLTYDLSIEIQRILKKRASRPYILDWLGSDSPGVADGFLVDGLVLNAFAQQHYKPQLIRMPNCYLATPGFTMAPPTIRRADFADSKDMVFLVNSRPRKLSEDFMSAVIRIVQLAPHHRLWIRAYNQDCQDLWANMAVEADVDVLFLPYHATEEEARGVLTQVDCLLDTYPYNGTTSTLEALWAGVPVLSYCGEQFASRQGATLISHAMMKDMKPMLVQSDWDTYVAMAGYLGSRSGIHALLWRSQRDRIIEQRRYAPLWDVRGWVREFGEVMEGVVKVAA